MKNQCHTAHRQKTYKIDCLNCFLRNIQKRQQRYKHGAAAHTHAAYYPCEKSEQYKQKNLHCNS